MKNVFPSVALAVAFTAAGFAQELPRTPAPWSAQTLDKKVLELKQYKGKYVALAFLLTT